MKEFGRARLPPSRELRIQKGSVGASSSRNKDWCEWEEANGRVSGFRQRGSQNDGAFPAASILLIFPHGSAALDERLQALVGVFQSHELVQIDILRCLQSILKT